MIELLQAQAHLARSMASLRSLSPEERTEWRNYYLAVRGMLERLQRPPQRPPVGPMP